MQGRLQTLLAEEWLVPIYIHPSTSLLTPQLPATKFHDTMDLPDLPSPSSSPLSSPSPNPRLSARTASKLSPTLSSSQPPFSGPRSPTPAVFSPSVPAPSSVGSSAPSVRGHIPSTFGMSVYLGACIRYVSSYSYRSEAGGGHGFKAHRIPSSSRRRL